ncbi:MULTISPECIES: OsmC family protein [unclassified Nocardioides]|uniref:OsmC family protein n=1 Tax=Nocardioides sp. (strain ATCC BAA-499 / JS614) TaxID=196162 RepID=UPI0000EB61DF|nr:OsmC family protein [Nocardioides sp. JS614]
MTTADHPQPDPDQPALPDPDTPRPDTLRHIDLHKIGVGRFMATNGRGGVLPVGSGADPDFTPVELLLAALAGCSAIDVDLITGKRAAATTFEVAAEGDKIRDEEGNRLVDIRLTFHVRFPDGEDGDQAREVLPRSVEMSRDRLCTVGRTVQLGAPIEYGVR